MDKITSLKWVFNLDRTILGKVFVLLKVQLNACLLCPLLKFYTHRINGSWSWVSSARVIFLPIVDEGEFAHPENNCSFHIFKKAQSDLKQNLTR